MEQELQPRLERDELITMIEMAVESAQSRMLDKDRFRILFNLAMRELELDAVEAARMLLIAKPTVTRYMEGRAATHAMGRPSIFQVFLKYANQPVAQESAE